MAGLYLPLTNLILAANHLSVNLTLEGLPGVISYPVGPAKLVSLSSSSSMRCSSGTREAGGGGGKMNNSLVSWDLPANFAP
uniref:Uncharacterized protein n=1 Tax=Caenorhabditis japonica TaxID=281687 RepID=A0A8R1E8Z2_CAEJA